MLNKLTIALSTAVMLGAVSTASADFTNYDPWVDLEAFNSTISNPMDARAEAPAPYSVTITDEYDPWIQQGQ